jgi:2-polyprenyl-3-methyl-5-hydroxy-6-metoxy-1,4-benzoquinol methylase
MDTLSYFTSMDHIQVLDLGCGVGRNSIPIAEALKAKNGKVVCVDLIESTLTKLISYSNQYGVSEYIETRLSDIGEYVIADNEFDYILAVSALEHVESELKLIQVLENMKKGTKIYGMNCIIMNANIEEIDSITRASLEPFIELNMTTNHIQSLLSAVYTLWEVIYTTTKALEFTIVRNERQILLKSDCITYVVQRTQLES